MGEKASFFVLRAKAVPEVLLRVVEAKRLLDSGKVESVQEATEMVQISRSSFYKYIVIWNWHSILIIIRLWRSIPRPARKRVR